MAGASKRAGLTIEVLGPWLRNKGDVLNLRAVCSRYEDTCVLAASSTLGLAELPSAPALHRIRVRPDRRAAQRGLFAGSVKDRVRWLSGTLAVAANARPVLRRHGLVSARDVDVLLDCSGYAYGDVWSTKRLDKRTVHLDRLGRPRAFAVMLPQALGPFDRPAMRDSAKRLFEHYDLIFARDRISLHHVRSLELAKPAIEMAPDITHLVEGVRPANPGEWRTRVCVVPNARMLDRVAEQTADRYVAFLTSCLEVVRRSGLEPCLVVHEENDRELAQELHAAGDVSVPIVDEDAVVTKGILGASYGVIASRYHALVSSLSQGTPVIGTSWSHKYEELFSDYGCEEYLLSPLLGDVELRQVLEQFLHEENRDRLHDRLSERADAQQQAVRAMWDRINSMLPVHSGIRSGHRPWCWSRKPAPGEP